MRLKKIKLAGFKSFVDPTTIPFPSEMTAVVGPNGCGKSNVIDAVRWVLGESSAKNLRGDAMTDVIFNGSSARKPVSQCSVELVFDNSSGRIQGEYAGYNELSVKRIVTKDAQSSYLLNNTKCRKRDVTDLFLGTGLGPRSYAIIEQGMISRLIESKPQELRVFIEEAAGVSKYKERRRETETRIRHSKENLERLEDVRGELGQQLDKLQRQAATAKRYKELKHNERKYKAELAAIRWLKHSDKIEHLEADINKKNADIEAYVAQQRGDEKDISAWKEQQQDFKQDLANLQQQSFKVGTDITRIEQNQLHAKQRRQQIEQEIQTLQQSLNENVQQEQQNIERLEELTAQIDSLAPEKELLEEQVEQLQSQLFEIEEQSNSNQSKWRHQEQEFNQRKSQAQSCHGKIQSLMSMQLRTQQRISELKEELAEVVDITLTPKIEAIQRQNADLQGQIEIGTEQCLESEQQFELALAEQKDTEQRVIQHQGKLQSITAQFDALNALQNSANELTISQQQLDALGIDSHVWWQTLDIAPGWETAFETITQQWQSALLVDKDASSQDDLANLQGLIWIFKQPNKQVAPENTIATKLNNTEYPSWLNFIYFAEDLQQAQLLAANLQAGESVITKQGCWLAADWMINGKGDTQAGLLKRASQIKALEEEQQLLAKQLTSVQAELAQQSATVKQASAQHSQAKQALEAVTRNLFEGRSEEKLLLQQQQQNLARNHKLSQELASQQQTFSEEQQSLEVLSVQAEELEMLVEESQEQQLELERMREDEQQTVMQRRANLEDSKSKLHHLALHLQSIQSQYQNLQLSQQRELQLNASMAEKLGLLTAEIEELASPLAEQEENLQQLLEQKAELELQQSDIADKLGIVEEKLLEAEKGQQGVTDKIQSMLTELQSIKLECEGYRVRAKGVLEQFEEMQLNIKQVLENLPTDADEASWQVLLEKTSASLSRLGAVNLAAVEEYEVQAQRKKHLDDQNDDLVSALDILEQAIRKIDKETRSRFKETFEQVNEDLKMLFPKVFGGGSAYLALTDEDLLETGVTIMARPPGKKNSTIHLLSGGEKALTALSLVFAIFRLNPAPFCLLDEVDAPLDDANVGRFCKLVSEMSKSVQFIYITHNKIAMEMATHLTGVTMAEPGVSRMVAVDVDEAVAIAHA
ncbi:chromosome segregation protein SMC [Paraglaciecola aquimarina]|uniref:Chromosome partition protein Smc n=1 Tax=Paraglaciecola aquimarina TaxID=1235557 RepID=A0ABU3SYY4_9ALTE|nr:chromosome segregation protein SMC [Paraglaciecola aquimarina]MDU0355229.1 chromosome segregation protein SMC [Paraglaciecola aquimarina]